MRRAVAAALAAFCLLALPLPARAQEGGGLGPLTAPTAPGPVRSAVLTIDMDRIFVESAFGQRVAAEIRAATEALAAENREIESRLVQEEEDLTQRRPEMDPAGFRREAAAFDTEVQRIRAEQDAKERALQVALETGREEFLAAATPILGRILLESGGAVLLDRRTVILGVNTVDITDTAIARIDAEVGDGSDVTIEGPPAVLPIPENEGLSGPSGESSRGPVPAPPSE